MKSYKGSQKEFARYVQSEIEDDYLEPLEEEEDYANKKLIKHVESIATTSFPDSQKIESHQKKLEERSSNFTEPRNLKTQDVKAHAPY